MKPSCAGCRHWLPGPAVTVAVPARSGVCGAIGTVLEVGQMATMSVRGNGDVTVELLTAADFACAQFHGHASLPGGYPFPHGPVKRGG